MKKAILILLVLVFSYAGNCAALEVKLNYATHTLADDQFDQLVTTPLFAEITKATKGQVTFEKHFNQALLAYDDMWDGLAEGRAGIGLVISPFFYERTPLSNVMDLPTLPFTNAADHAAAMWRIYEKYPDMQAEYRSQGLHPLLFLTTGQEYLFTSQPVAKLEDLRDMQLISDSMITVKQFEFFDSSDMQFAQLYEIFNMSEYEAYGFAGSPEVYAIWKLADATPYATIAPLSFTYITIAMSESKWQELPPDMQEQIMDICGEAASSKYSAAYSEYYLKDIKKAGSTLTFVELTPEERERWIYLNQPLIDEWIMDCAEHGLGKVAERIYADLQRAAAP